MKRLALLLLLLPLAVAKTAIYAKGFSLECYIYRDSVSELVPESPYVLSAFLEDAGFDVEVISDTKGLKQYDAVIVLSCTEMAPEDVERILEYYRSGGGLIVDLRSYNPVAEELGVIKKSYPLEGISRGSLSTTYATVTNGVLVSSPLVSSSSPVRFGYERMYYIGEPIYLPDGFSSGFATETGEDVLGWRVDSGRVVVTGCLYCSGPLLLANLVDWAEDGYVDFPDFSVTRDVIPKAPFEGETVADMIRVVTDERIQVEGEYVYGISGPFCDFGEPSAEFKGPQRVGDRIEMEAVFSYEARGSGTCLLPPVLLTLRFEDKKREVIVDPVEVVVSRKRISVYTEEALKLLPWLLGVLLLGLVLARPYLRVMYLRRMRDKYRGLIKLTMKRRMQGELDEESYKELMHEYQKKLQDIEYELMQLSSGKRGKQGRSKLPPWRRQAKQGPPPS